MSEVAEHRPEQHEDQRAPGHLAVDRHEQRRHHHEEDEGSPPAEAIGDEAEREIAEVRANLHGDDPPERAHDAHAGAALRHRAGEEGREPEEDAPVGELD